MIFYIHWRKTYFWFDQKAKLLWWKHSALATLGPLCLWQCSHNFSEQSMKLLLPWFQLFQESKTCRCPSCPLARAAAVLCLHCCQKSSSFLEWYIEWYHLMIYSKISLHCCQKSSSFLQTSFKLYLVDQDQRAPLVIFYLSARIASTQAEVKAPLQPHIHRCINSCSALSSAKFAKSTIYQNSGCSMIFSCHTLCLTTLGRYAI